MVRFHHHQMIYSSKISKQGHFFLSLQNYISPSADMFFNDRIYQKLCLVIGFTKRVPVMNLWRVCTVFFGDLYLPWLTFIFGFHLLTLWQYILETLISMQNITECSKKKSLFLNVFKTKHFFYSYMLVKSIYFYQFALLKTTIYQFE